MKKILNAFSKEKTQKILFLGMLVLVFGVFMLSIFLGGSQVDNPADIDEPGNVDSPPDNPEQKPHDENDTKEKYKAPCDLELCSTMRHFYSLDDDTTTQEMSLIQVGTKYMISRGVTYRNELDETFDVVATLSGTVTDVQESSLYGNVITIDHGNNIKSEYLGVSNVLVKTGDKVSQGDVIASSGKADYDTIASNHVHFRVSVNGSYVDPENLYETDRG